MSLSKILVRNLNKTGVLPRKSDREGDQERPIDPPYTKWTNENVLFPITKTLVRIWTWRVSYKVVISSINPFWNCKGNEYLTKRGTVGETLWWDQGFVTPWETRRVKRKIPQPGDEILVGPHYLWFWGSKSQVRLTLSKIWDTNLRPISFHRKLENWCKWSLHRRSYTLTSLLLITIG